MPWTADDAESHTKKADTPKKKKAWAEAANAALKEYGGDEGKAVATANAAVDKMGDDDDRAFDPTDCLTRSMTLEMEPKSYDSGTRTAEAIISSGARVRRRDFWSGDEFDEVLDMSPQSIRLNRLNAGAQLIDGHNHWAGLDAILGAVVPGSARLDNGKLRARFKFSRSEKGQRVAQDLADGIPVPLSVGYKTHREVRDETTSPVTRMAIDWEPMEVSVVAIGAEAGAGFRSDPLTHRAAPATGDKTMKEPTTKTGGEAAGTMTEEQKRAAADEQARKAAEETKKRVDEEMARATAADALKKAQEYAAEMVAIGRQASLPVDRIEDAIKRSLTPDAFRKEIIERLADDSKKTAVRGASGGTSGENDRLDPTRIEVGRDELDGRVEAVSEALTIRVLAHRRMPAITSEPQREWANWRGLTDEVARAFRVMDEKEQPRNPRTRAYLKMGWSEIAAECLGYRGHIRTFRQAEDLITRAFQATADYPSIFANVLNKSMLARYTLQMPTYREIAIERPFNDFRPHPQIRAGEFPLPAPLTETGELTAGGSADNREDLTVKPYGRIFSISRQMLVNDEMGAIDQILASAADAVLIFENNTFFTMFNSNPTLKQDSTAVFDATTHKNYQSSGSEPNILSIGKGRAAMRVQTSLSGNLIDTPPAIILTGPAHETRADQITAAINPTLTGAVNPFSGKLRNVTTAKITGNEWYLFCNPAQVPVFAYGFLAGATGPRIRTEEPFGYQGVRTSLEVDFGCGAIDFRGAYKDAGSAATELLGVMGTKTIS